MESEELQYKISKSFEIFGVTPLEERMNDIRKEFTHLIRYRDPKNLKEEVGDLMSSLIQLCNENSWSVDELIDNNLQKINSRTLQYKSLGRKINVAILGGAFNPITIGHIQSAQFVLNTSKRFDEVWLMPSFNHMYHKDTVLPQHRINMCKLASKIDGRIKVFDYEIKNQLSGETYNFVKRLKMETELTEKYKFSLIIGLDNANTFDRWVNYEELEKLMSFVVIPRKGYTRDENVNWYLKYPHIYLNDENKIIEISSTTVREMLDNFYKPNSTVKYNDFLSILNKEVLDYILENELFMKK